MPHKLDDKSVTTIITALRALQTQRDPRMATFQSDGIPVLSNRDIDRLCDGIAFDGLLDPAYTKQAVALLEKPPAQPAVQKATPSPRYHGAFVPVPYGEEWMLQEALDGCVIRYGMMLKDETGAFRRFKSKDAAAAFVRQMELNKAA